MLAALAAAAAQADLLRLKGDVSYQGQFTAFKQEKFYFQTSDGKELIELRVKVVELKLAPPANVIVKPHGKSKRDDLKLAGYEDSTFRFSAGGRLLTMTSPTVASIQMGLDFDRAALPAGVQTVSGGTGTVDIASLLTPGVVTVIHFHMPGVVSSVRQGSYLGTLAADSKGKMKAVKIELTGFDAAVARKYGITSAPQFWFYNAGGRLVKKLTDRFTEEDIAQALKDAMR